MFIYVSHAKEYCAYSLKVVFALQIDYNYVTNCVETRGCVK